MPETDNPFMDLPSAASAPPSSDNPFMDIPSSSAAPNGGIGDGSLKPLDPFATPDIEVPGFAAPGVVVPKMSFKSPSDYSGLIQKYAGQNNIDPALVDAVIKQESSYNPNAKSKVGAAGLMQLMPGTAQGLGVTNPYDPDQNIRGGTKYLASLLKQFGDVKTALAAYNAGPGAVQRAKGIPNYIETHDYIQKVMQNYNDNLNQLGLSQSQGETQDTEAHGDMILRSKAVALQNQIKKTEAAGQDSKQMRIDLSNMYQQMGLPATGEKPSSPPTAIPQGNTPVAPNPLTQQLLTPGGIPAPVTGATNPTQSAPPANVPTDPIAVLKNLGIDPGVSMPTASPNPTTSRLLQLMNQPHINGQQDASAPNPEDRLNGFSVQDYMTAFNNGWSVVKPSGPNADAFPEGVPFNVARRRMIAVFGPDAASTMTQTPDQAQQTLDDAEAAQINSKARHLAPNTTNDPIHNLLQASGALAQGGADAGAKIARFLLSNPLNNPTGDKNIQGAAEAIGATIGGLPGGITQPIVSTIGGIGHSAGLWDNDEGDALALPKGIVQMMFPKIEQQADILWNGNGTTEDKVHAIMGLLNPVQDVLFDKDMTAKEKIQAIIGQAMILYGGVEGLEKYAPKLAGVIEAVKGLSGESPWKGISDAAARPTTTRTDLTPSAKPQAETPPQGTTGPATWNNNGVDQPVHVTGTLGDMGGRTYVSIEGSSTGVPLDELTFIKQSHQGTTLPVETRNTSTPIDIGSPNLEHITTADGRGTQFQVAPHVSRLIKELQVGLRTFGDLTNEELGDISNAAVSRLMTTDDGIHGYSKTPAVETAGTWHKLRAAVMEEINARRSDLQVGQHNNAITVQSINPDGTVTVKFADGSTEDAPHNTIAKIFGAKLHGTEDPRSPVETPKPETGQVTPTETPNPIQVPSDVYSKGDNSIQDVPPEIQAVMDRVASRRQAKASEVPKPEVSPIEQTPEAPVVSTPEPKIETQSKPIETVETKTPDTVADPVIRDAHTPEETHGGVTQSEFEAAKARRGGAMKSKNAGAVNISAQDFQDAATLGKWYLGKGLSDFGEWSKAMIAHFPEWTSDHLKEIWDHINPESEIKPEEIRHQNEGVTSSDVPSEVRTETSSDNPDVTGLARKFEDPERESRGQEPTAPTHRSPEEWRQAGLDEWNNHKTNKGGIDPEKVVNDTIQSGRLPTPLEAATTVVWKDHILEESRAIAAREPLPGSENYAENHKAWNAEFNKSLDNLNKISEYAQLLRGGQGWHGLGTVLNMGLDREFNLADISRQRAEMIKGSPLTTEELAKSDAYAKKLEDNAKELQKAREDHQKIVEAKDAEIAKLKAQAEIARQARESRSKSRMQTVEQIKAVREDAFSRMAKAMSGANAELPGSAPLSIEAYKALKDIAHSYIAEGVTKLADLTDRIISEAKAKGFEISERNVHDALTGSYEKPQKTQSELRLQIAELTKQARLQSRIEDALNGIKTEPGNKIQTSSAEVNALKGHLDQLLKELGQGSRQDSSRTRMSKTIQDLRNQLETQSRKLKTERTVDPEDIAAMKKTAMDLRSQMRTLDNIETMKEQIRTKNFKKTERPVAEMSPELKRLKMQEQLVLKQKEAWERSLLKPTWGQWVGKTIRFNVLTSAGVFPKIVANIGARIAFIPIEQLIAQAVGHLPLPDGIKISDVLSEYSIPAKDRLSAYAESVRTFRGDSAWNDAKQTFLTGSGPVDAFAGKAYGSDELTLGGMNLQQFLDIPGRSHGALKALPSRWAFDMYANALGKAFESAGRDIHDPMVQHEIFQTAAIKAMMEKFQDKNTVAQKIAEFRNSLETGNNAAQTLSIPVNLASIITTIPLNFMKRVAAAHGWGVAEVIGRYGKIWYDAKTGKPITITRETLDPIVSAAKKGGTGLAIAVTAWMFPNLIRVQDDNDPGTASWDKDDIEIMGHRVHCSVLGFSTKAAFTHVPEVWAYLTFARMARAQQGERLKEGGKALMEHERDLETMPPAGAIITYGKNISAHGGWNAFGNFVKPFVPFSGIAGNIAQAQDTKAKEAAGLPSELYRSASIEGLDKGDPRQLFGPMAKSLPGIKGVPESIGGVPLSAQQMQLKAPPSPTGGLKSGEPGTERAYKFLLDVGINQTPRPRKPNETLENYVASLKRVDVIRIRLVNNLLNNPANKLMFTDPEYAKAKIENQWHIASQDPSYPGRPPAGPTQGKSKTQEILRRGNTP